MNDYALDHIVINVDNVSAMLAFYSDVLLMPIERQTEYDAGEEPFPSVRLNPDTIIDLFPKKFTPLPDSAAPQATNLNHFCLTMNKTAWETLRQMLQAHTVAIEEGSFARWGARENGTSVYFRDPENNLIEARYYDNDC